MCGYGQIVSDVLLLAGRSALGVADRHRGGVALKVIASRIEDGLGDLVVDSKIQSKAHGLSCLAVCTCEAPAQAAKDTAAKAASPSGGPGGSCTGCAILSRNLWMTQPVQLPPAPPPLRGNLGHAGSGGGDLRHLMMASR